MEALTDLKYAQNGFNEADIAARAAERRSVTKSAGASPAGAAWTAVGRRRFVAATVSFGVLTIGFMARGRLASIAAPSTPRVIGNSFVLADFANLDRTYAESGITSIQTSYATGTDSDALRILRWIRERKHIGTMGFLASCMTDPRTDVRWAAVRAGLDVSPVGLKPHLMTVQAAANAESNPAIQSLFVALIPTVQSA